MTAITLDLHSIVELTDEQFYKLCQANPDVKPRARQFVIDNS